MTPTIQKKKMKNSITNKANPVKNLRKVKTNS
jgi:hypothetical protein